MKEHLWDEQRSREQYRAEYARWAKTYDEELLKEWEYKLPEAVCELFKKYVKKQGSSQVGGLEHSREHFAAFGRCFLVWSNPIAQKCYLHASSNSCSQTGILIPTWLDGL